MQTYPSAISDATLTVSNAAYIPARDVSAVLTFSVESVCAVSSSAVSPVEGSSVDGFFYNRILVCITSPFYA